MSQGTENTDAKLEIKDLPPEEALTPEEKERLAGAGRHTYRPTFEGLEARLMMDGTGIGGAIAAPLAPAGGGNAPQNAQVRTVNPTGSQAQPAAAGQLGKESATANTTGKLVFSDDFHQDVGTRPDKSTWYSDDKPGNNTDKITKKVVYDNKYVDSQGRRTLGVVDDSDASDGKALAMTIFPKDSDGNYKSARINTSQDPVAGSLLYGHIEARIKLPGGKDGQGVFPAFWMLGKGLADQTETWPKCGEIDIMEYWGSHAFDKNGKSIQDYASGTLVLAKGNDATFERSDYHLPDGASFHDGGYHTFAVDWSKDSVSFSVDGHVYNTLTKSEYVKQGYDWNFDKPFYIVLNVSSNAGQNGGSKVLNTPQTMYVDYVRAYSSSTPTLAAVNNNAPTAGGLAGASSVDAASAADGGHETLGAAAGNTSANAAGQDLIQGGVAIGVSLPKADNPTAETYKATLKDYTEMAGKSPATTNAFFGWNTDGHVTGSLKSFVESTPAGVTPMLTWMPGGDGKTPNQLPAINNHAWDKYITEMANYLHSTDRPVLLRFGHEMNLSSYSYSGDPKAYVQAFQHVVTLFRDAGADNVKFVWAPNNVGTNLKLQDGVYKPDGVAEINLATAKAYYPGDQYVDILGFDAYPDNDHNGVDFAKLIRGTYNTIAGVTDGKPIMISETGTGGTAEEKSNFIKSMDDAIAKGTFTRLKAINYFDVHKEGGFERNWTIDQYQEAKDAWRALVKKNEAQGSYAWDYTH